MSAELQDWTQGGTAILYQRCATCSHVQYFARLFCAACGSTEVALHPSSGVGVVYATSLVHRAPTAAARAHVPYNIVLVDMAESFRLMGHGTEDLKIGNSVSAHYREFVDAVVPFFERKPE